MSRGYVYLIRNGDLYKIGRTSNLERRLKQLQPCVLVQSLITDRSNWIRNCCTTYLSGGAPNPHTEIDDINVIDTRAREVIRSMLQRLDRLKAAQFGEDSTADPFD